MSGPKISYLRDLATRVTDGRLDLHALDDHDDEQVVEAITAVKGLGRWSAEMFLMFRLNRPDIFPVGDLGIVKGMQRLLEMKSRPAPSTMLRTAELGGPIDPSPRGTCGGFSNEREGRGPFRHRTKRASPSPPRHALPTDRRC